MKRIAQSRHSEVYELPDGQVWKWYYSWIPEPLVSYEFTVGRAVHDLGFPTPAPLRLAGRGPRPGIVFERVSGKLLAQRLAAQPWKLQARARQMAAFHRLLHALPTVALRTQAERLDEAFRASAPLLLPYQELLDDLRTRFATPARQSICHGDFSPDNVLVRPGGWCLLDWPNAYQGDPLSDVARTCLLLQSPHTLRRQPRWQRWAFRAATTLLARTYARHYLRLSGRTAEALRAWQALEAAVRLHERVPGEEGWLLSILRRHRAKRFLGMARRD